MVYKEHVKNIINIGKLEIELFLLLLIAPFNSKHGKQTIERQQKQLTIIKQYENTYVQALLFIAVICCLILLLNLFEMIVGWKFYVGYISLCVLIGIYKNYKFSQKNDK